MVNWTELGLLSSRVGLVWLIGSPVAGFSQAVAPTAIPLEQHVRQVAAYLTGAMEASAPSSSKPGQRVTVRMVTCEIPLPSPGTTVLLYQEQALTDELTQPYRQRFLEISASPYSQTVRSRSYKPISPSQWINFCNQSGGDRTRQVSRLNGNWGTPVCTVFLKPNHSNDLGDIYLGNTPADGCPAKVRGAVRITNHIRLHRTGMETWDRGFDAQGKQVWGAKVESYQFHKVATPSPAPTPSPPAP